MQIELFHIYFVFVTSLLQVYVIITFQKNKQVVYGKIVSPGGDTLKELQAILPNEEIINKGRKGLK